MCDEKAKQMEKSPSSSQCYKYSHTEGPRPFATQCNPRQRQLPHYKNQLDVLSYFDTIWQRIWQDAKVKHIPWSLRSFQGQQISYIPKHLNKLRAVFKVPQISVQEFVTGAGLTIVRPADPLAEGHLNNSANEITLGQNFSVRGN